MKKAFSLIEVIFVISLIGIISSVAISNFSQTINQTNIIKLKSDILNIQTKLNDIKTNSILSNNLNNTKNNNLDLSSLILNNNLWQKISDTIYTAKLNNDTSVTFIYNTDDLTFDCDKKDDYCSKYFR